MASEPISSLTGPPGETTTVTIDAEGQTKTITTDASGAVTTVTTDTSGDFESSTGFETEAHGVGSMPPEPAFFLGLLVGALLLWAFQAWGRIAARRATARSGPDAVASELAALRQRTAVLERLATDRSNRLAEQIDELRTVPSV